MTGRTLVNVATPLVDSDIVLTGATGFLGRAVLAGLRARGLDSARLHTPGSGEFDLRDPVRCRMLFDAVLGGEPNPRAVVIHCAGFVGGLGLNRLHPARMFHDNLLMALNVVEAATRAGLAKRGAMVLVGSMTAYPADAPMPLREEALFTGRPDAEIASYGIAKLATLQMLHAYAREHGLVSACPIPSNLYGPGDEVDDPLVAHAAGALLKRFADAATSGVPEVLCWGSGTPTRDFLFIDDAAEGVIRCAEHVASVAAARAAASDAPAARGTITPEPLVVNLSGGKEVSLRVLAEMLADLTGYTGRVLWDTAKGDGMARRVLDTTRATQTLGWTANTPLREGLARAVAWYRGRTGSA